MRTSLNNIKSIEEYLFGDMSPEDALLFELLHTDLIDDMKHQQHAYSLIRQYSRQQLKAEIVAVQETLQHQGFMERIKKLFTI